MDISFTPYPSRAGRSATARNNPPSTSTTGGKSRPRRSSTASRPSWPPIPSSIRNGRLHRRLLRRIHDDDPGDQDSDVRGGTLRRDQLDLQLLGRGIRGYTYSRGHGRQLPLNRKDIYVDRSPLFHADKITTPLLLLHGSADTNVPPGESISFSPPPQASGPGKPSSSVRRRKPYDYHVRQEDSLQQNHPGLVRLLAERPAGMVVRFVSAEMRSVDVRSHFHSLCA